MEGQKRSSEILLSVVLLFSMAGPVIASSLDETGRLEPCPETPNCVSTQAVRESQRMPPIPFNGDPSRAMELLVDVLEAQPRVAIESTGERSIVSVFTTRILRFKDDVVFFVDPDERAIHFRSASRVGRSDLGANRERMERLTRLFLEAQSEDDSDR